MSALYLAISIVVVLPIFILMLIITFPVAVEIRRRVRRALEPVGEAPERFERFDRSSRPE